MIPEKSSIEHSFLLEFNQVQSWFNQRESLEIADSLRCGCRSIPVISSLNPLELLGLWLSPITIQSKIQSIQSDSIYLVDFFCLDLIIKAIKVIMLLDTRDICMPHLLDCYGLRDSAINQLRSISLADFVW